MLALPWLAIIVFLQTQTTKMTYTDFLQNKTTFTGIDLLKSESKNIPVNFIHSTL